MRAQFYDLELAFIAGPAELGEPISSVALDDPVEYTPEEIVEAFLAVQGCQVTHPATPTWWQWRARWTSEGDTLDLDMTLFDVEPLLWGGSGIEHSCSPTALLSFWESVRVRCPAVYLHDSACTIYPPNYFAKQYL